MAQESFLLFSLKEDKSKKLAQVISNETARKILDYMSAKGNKTITETELATALKLPISTVHYNMKHLMDAKLVQADEFHYSEKGKEVNHYSLSNKLIIIAPSTSEKFIEKLKKILPVALISLVAASFVQLFSKVMQGNAFASAQKATTDSLIQERGIETLGEGSAKLAASAAAPAQLTDSAASATGIAQNYYSNIASTQINYAPWFLFGALFALIMYFVWDWFIERKKSK
ncbi:MAG: helix-turn-helix domain-containing protein [Nanoarchaeota archaeon]|nr:helix-turn-helix domain-containing protein [Nanoarchaeota archaeon]